MFETCILEPQQQIALRGLIFQILVAKRLYTLVLIIFMVYNLASCVQICKKSGFLMTLLGLYVDLRVKEAI